MLVGVTAGPTGTDALPPIAAAATPTPAAPATASVIHIHLWLRASFSGAAVSVVSAVAFENKSGRPYRRALRPSPP